MNRSSLIVVLILTLFLSSASHAYSVRAMGMGDIFSPASKDPSGIFYNPAYLARADGLRLSLDNIEGPLQPRNSVAFSLGDLGIAATLADQQYTGYLGHGFNVFSFLRLGVGVKVVDSQKDIDTGLEVDLAPRLRFSMAILNDEADLFSRKYSMTVAYHTEDMDRSIAVNYDLDDHYRAGFEQQIGPRAFIRAGYKVDHPTIGLTLPLGNYLDVDLAADFARDNTRVLFGLNLFRFTENKSVNNNHSLNFGKAIVGEDRFEKIDNYNIHYVDTAPNANALSLPRALSRGSTLVLIGGGIHYTHHWDCYMPELAKHYRVINIDHVGAGESDKPTYFFGYSIGEQGEIINELLNRLEIKECYVLGYCYGGSIAFYLAAHYPERYKKVIAIEGFVEGINAVPISDEKSREGARSARHNIEYFGAYGLRDVIITKYRMDYPYLNWQMWYQVNRDVLYLDLRSEIKDIKAPVLYYAGGKSWANEFLGPTKDYINNNLENLSYVYIEGAGHDVDRCDQEKFMEQVIGFLGD